MRSFFRAELLFVCSFLLLFSGCQQGSIVDSNVDNEVSVIERDSDAGRNFDGVFDPLHGQDVGRELRREVNLGVPFTSQAPDGNWDSPYDEACEEASLLMVEYFYRGEELTKEISNREINALYDWQTVNGYTVDVEIAELADIARDYYGREGKVYYDEDVTIENIKFLVDSGYPVIIPAAGRMLGNPNFSGEGPPYHMVVVTGYDGKYFYTNDPGTRRGERFRYKQGVFVDAIRDWTGSVLTINSGRKALLVLK